jgi:hypothetical protein
LNWIVLLIPNRHHSIFNPEGIAKIVIQRITADLDVPAIQILAIEELPPLFIIGLSPSLRPALTRLC